MSKLTEKRLAQEIRRHCESCDRCDQGFCPEVEAIEGSFWDAVDSAIDAFRNGDNDEIENCHY